MKRLLILTLCFITTIPGLAQRDIKTLDRIGRNAIISILGSPDGKEYYGGVMDGYDAIQYPNTYICLDAKTAELVGFDTSSSSFCVLSNFISGGFKVGDSLAKLKRFDFVHSSYGKNRSGNALKLIDSTEERDCYEVYGKERCSFYFYVKNGIINGIGFAAKDQDEVSDLGCDMSNSPW